MFTAVKDFTDKVAATPEKGLVSVVLIFLNGERFLEEAVESVLNQSYDRWELLLVNDGSTDRSEEIARRYEAREPGRVRYLEHEGGGNLGMSASRNLGIREGRGEMVAFLDADDVWEREKLSEQVALLEAHPRVAMLYGRTRKWFGWTGKPEDLEKDSVTQLAVPPDTIAQPPVLLTRFLENENVYPCTCSMIVRREVFDRVGAFEESFKDAYEDMVFHTKVFLSEPVFVSSACWDRYRRHPDNSWKRAVKAGLYDPFNPNPLRLKYLNWVEQYLLTQGVKNREVWRALRRELWPYRHNVLYGISKRARSFGRAAILRARSAAARALPAPAKDWVRNQIGAGK